MDKYLLWHQLSLVQQLDCVCDTTAKGAVQRAITTGYISTPTQLLPQEDVAIDTRKWPHDRFNEVDWEHLDLAMKSKMTCTKYGDPSSTQGFVAPGSRLANTPGWNARTRNVPTVAVGKRLRTFSYVQTKTGLAY